ncbi:diguanylate cyclase [Candidatus Reidiella endopervernicosa]|uniref:diguanylate cyclase n=1 Tax=Candidatus Reidiella endopervernicosa TaxID=2738883 RepID=A0A6N0HWE7_9GAMM|nr:diguanylate cyclase [Candidatus Reidiella endopervernicosa]QKQ26703.1 diguanylate cyclase [Candidatus Reidiella endopervernicosa]
MGSASESIEERLKALHINYLQGLPAKFAVIDDQWRKLCESPKSHERLTELHRSTHTMAGSGATFGCPEVGSAARNIESNIRLLIESDQPLDEQKVNEIETLIDRLKEEIDAVTSRGWQEGESIETLVAEVPSESEHDEQGDDEGSRGLIYLLEQDEPLSKEIALQIVQFGHQIRCFKHPDALRSAVLEQVPQIVIADLSSFGSEQSGVDAIHQMQEHLSEPVPVIFVSEKSEMHARLESVRAGGAAFFTKPLDIAILIDRLDQIGREGGEEPFRILIVDDSVSQSKYYAMILQQHGMITKVVNNPIEVLEPIQELNPDLILIDMYMPECNGLELAKVIRQLNECVSLPIVFLSSETSVDKQLVAMSQGGDDFLTKPIKPNHLISAVTSRVQRYRTIRSMMLRDSLTGLYNHTTIKEQLKNALHRAERHDGVVSFAMIDIDNFKSVNDTYGHPVGDRVIKSLSRLLQQRMRRSDLVGRYGGEEFAVILPNTDKQTAVRVLDSVREVFSKMQHSAEQGSLMSPSVPVLPASQNMKALLF